MERTLPPYGGPQFYRRASTSKTFINCQNPIQRTSMYDNGSGHHKRVSTNIKQGILYPCENTSINPGQGIACLPGSKSGYHCFMPGLILGENNRRRVCGKITTVTYPSSISSGPGITEAYNSNGPVSTEPLGAFPILACPI